MNLVLPFAEVTTNFKLFELGGIHLIISETLGPYFSMDATLTPMNVSALC